MNRVKLNCSLWTPEGFLSGVVDVNKDKIAKKYLDDGSIKNLESSKLLLDPDEITIQERALNDAQNAKAEAAKVKAENEALKEQQKELERQLEEATKTASSQAKTKTTARGGANK